MEENIYQLNLNPHEVIANSMMVKLGMYVIESINNPAAVTKTAMQIDALRNFMSIHALKTLKLGKKIQVMMELVTKDNPNIFDLSVK